MSFLIDLLLAIALLGSMASCGKRLLVRLGFSFSSELQSFVIGLAAGTVMVMFGTLLMGLLGFIQLAPISILVSILFVLGIPDYLRWLKKVYALRPFGWIREQPKFFQLILLVSFIMLIANAIRTNTPPITDDELSYHLYGSKFYAQSGTWKPPPVDHCPNYYPQTPEMLYTIGMLLHRDITPATIHFLFALTSVLLVVLIARRIAEPLFALLAGIIFYTMPRFTSLTHVAYTDFIILLLCLAAFECYLEWQQSNGRRWILLGFVLLSAAITSKFSVLTIFIPYLMFFCFDSWKTKMSPKEFFKILVFGGTSAILFIAPWFVRNYIYKGNIFYPFSFFGTAGDDIFNWHLQSSHAGFATKLRTIFLAPHHLLTFDFSQGTGPILMLFPLIFLAKPIPSLVWRIFIFSALHIILSILKLHGAGTFRYVLMSHALLSIVAGLGIGNFLNQATPRASILLKTMIVCSLLFPHLAFAAGGAIKRFSYFIGKMSREAYLQKFYDQEGYDTVIFCNQKLPKDAKILLIYADVARPYYYNADLVFCNSIKIMNSPDYKTIQPYLDQNGITHVLFMKYFSWQKDAEGVWELMDLFRMPWLKEGEEKSYFVPIFDNGKAILFKRSPRS